MSSIKELVSSLFDLILVETCRSLLFALGGIQCRDSHLFWMCNSV